MPRKIQRRATREDAVMELLPEAAHATVRQFAERLIGGTVLFETLREHEALLAQHYPKEHNQWRQRAPLVRAFPGITGLVSQADLGLVPKEQVVGRIHLGLCKDQRFGVSEELWIKHPDLWALIEASDFPTRKWRQDRERVAARKLARPIAEPFGADLVDLIHPFVPLPSLGRLGRTCVFIYVRVTPARLQQARERARETFGLFDTLMDSSFVLRSTNDEAIQVRRYGHFLLRVRMRGVDYIAENLMRGEDFRAALGTTAHRLWFRVREERDSLHVELGWSAENGPRQEALFGITAV